ncbi:MAG: type II secretion system protein C [Planctomycetota bacterium]
MAAKLLLRILGDRWLRALVLLLLLAMLAHQSSLLFWHFYHPAISANQLSPNTIVQSEGSDSSGVNYQQQAFAIGKAFLFGKPVVETLVEQVVEEAPETQLNYKLRGLYYSTDPGLASAIIEVKPNKSQFYVLHAELAEKITLSAINADHVIINRYGKLERLNLQKTVAGEGKSSISSASSLNSNPTHSAILRSYKKRYGNNPMALATRFQAIPVQENGLNIGFKLKALRGESLLKKLEFEDNDVFLAVNGVGLDNPFEAVDALKSLNTSDNVSVRFMRNGSEQSKDFKL